MIKSGITFVRVVKTPQVDFLDFSSQLEGRDTYKEVLAAIRSDHYLAHEHSSRLSSHIIEATLNILKAEFSAIDPKNVVPMWDDETPVEVELRAMFGTSRTLDEPISYQLELVDPDKSYEVHPKILSLPDLWDGLKVAEKEGHFERISFEELSKALKLLLSEQNLLCLDYKRFHHYCAPAVMILTGEQIRRSFIETRADTLLNTLFDKTPQTYRRFAALPQRTPG